MKMTSRGIAPRPIFALECVRARPLADEAPCAVPKVYLSPHAAGQTVDTYLRQGRAMVEEVERFLTGERLQYEIAAAALATMA